MSLAAIPGVGVERSDRSVTAANQLPLIGIRVIGKYGGPDTEAGHVPVRRGTIDTTYFQAT